MGSMGSWQSYFHFIFFSKQERLNHISIVVQYLETDQVDREKLETWGKDNQQGYLKSMNRVVSREGIGFSY